MTTTPFLDDPDSVVRAALDARAARRWRDLAALGDDADLEEFQRGWIEQLERLLAARARGGADRSYMIVGPQDPDELARLSPLEAATLWLELMDPVTRHARLFGSIELGLTDEQIAAIDAVRTEVLGHVREGERLAHVVYTSLRPNCTPPDTPHSIAITLRRAADGGWRAMLRHGFLYGGIVESPPIRVEGIPGERPGGR